MFHRSRRRTFAGYVPVVTAAIALLALAPLALADKGGTANGGGGGGGGKSSGGSTTGGGGGSTGGGSTGGGGTATTQTSTLAMTSQYVYWPDTWSPNCMTEDDIVQRSFSGALYGSSSTSYQLCDLNTDGWTAGGIGLESDVYVVGALSSLTIIAPDGSAHQAVLVGQTSAQGVTTSHYAVCYVPPYHISTDTGTAPLAGGTWQLTLSGQISSASWTTRAQMTNVSFQQSYCPATEQNLLP